MFHIYTLNIKNWMIPMGSIGFMKGDIMNLTINKNIKIPIYMQIKNEIKKRIFSGELMAYAQLPSERKLAEELGVNRSTVLNAYRELKSEGLIDSHIGQGTQIMPIIHKNDHKGNVSYFPISWQHMMSQEALLSQSTSIMDMLNVSAKNNMISFAAGMAAQELYPTKSIEALISTVHNNTQLPFLHTSVEGLFTLRENICTLMKRNGISATPEEVMVLSGSQQGLDLLARSYLDAGDIVIVEEPTYLGALQIFKAAGAKVIGVPIQEDGIRMDILEALIIKHKPKFFYTMPTFQNPSGRVMDMSQRLKLLELSYAYQLPIIEDDAYLELRYEGKALPSLKALDQRGNVLYLNTFSKFLFPGTRIGWLYAPLEVIKQLSIKKQMMDLHANSIGQWLLTQYLEKNDVQVHISNIVKVYRQKRDNMLKALTEYAPSNVTWSVPEGGFYIWCKLPDTINYRSLWVKAIDSDVAYVPGETFFPGKQGQNYIRLSFSFPSLEEIEIGIIRLMKVIKEVIEESNQLSIENNVKVNPMF